MGTSTDHTPPVDAARSGVAFGSQSLKSPTNATLDAFGATKPNCTSGDPAPARATSLSGTRAREGRSASTPAPIATANTSVAASAVSGDTRKVRGRVSRAMRSRKPPAPRCTSSITRASKSAASMRSGRRSSSAALFSTSSTSAAASDSSCWRILSLRQHPPHSLAGALHSHLERRYACPGDHRHLLVLHLLHVLHQKRLALIDIEPRQRPPDLLAQRARIRRMIERNRVVPVLRRHEAPLPPRVPSAGRSASIRENREQPTAEARTIAAPMERSIPTHERILQRLLGILPVAEHVQRESRVSIPVSGNELCVRFRVALENDVHERAVRKLHTRRDPGIEHGVTIGLERRNDRYGITTSPTRPLNSSCTVPAPGGVLHSPPSTRMLRRCEPGATWRASSHSSLATWRIIRGCQSVKSAISSIVRAAGART